MGSTAFPTRCLRWTEQSRAAFEGQHLTGSFYLYHSFSVIIAQPLSLTLWLQTDKDRSVEDYQLLIDLHKRAKRQGPGGDSETEKALSQAMIDRAAPLKIADIGCGTGASTL